MHKCNLCSGSQLTPLIDFGSHPVAKHYLFSAEDTRETYPVKLFFCEGCGLTQLMDSCPPEILYDNYVTLSSWKFQPHVQGQIDFLKSLQGFSSQSKIIEIGSNDGSFLKQLSSNGFKNSLGIEPAKDAYEIAIKNGVNVRNIFLCEKNAVGIAKEFSKFDLFVSRQNLEHMKDLGDVIKSIDLLLKEGGYALIEVPNFMANLEFQDYSLWEEHVNYFTTETLRYFLALANLEVIHSEIFCFSGEGIFVVAQKKPHVSVSLEYLKELKTKNLQYSKNWPKFLKKIRGYLASLKQKGKKIAVYGAGSRVFCLINFANISNYIDVIVDDQLEKQDKFMPGGKIPILSSSALNSLGIDICLLGVNTENEGKVISKHSKWIAAGGEFWSVLPPSDLLLPVWAESLI
jgi:SAM-dependent methyltransferase